MSEWCDFHDLPLNQCEHAFEATRLTRVRQLEELEIAPSKKAHFPGCWHKGDDPDKRKWGSVRHDPVEAWQRLGNGTPIYADNGSQVGATATSRCQDCEAHGPW